MAESKPRRSGSRTYTANQAGYGDCDVGVNVGTLGILA